MTKVTVLRGYNSRPTCGHASEGTFIRVHGAGMSLEIDVCEKCAAAALREKFTDGCVVIPMASGPPVAPPPLTPFQRVFVHDAPCAYPNPCGCYRCAERGVS